MLKEIRKREVCKSCGNATQATIYEVYCDKCGVLIEKGTTYGSRLSYTVWNNGIIEDFDSNHFERHFCSHECMLAKMKVERLGKKKYISITMHLDKKERDKLAKVIAV